MILSREQVIETLEHAWEELDIAITTINGLIDKSDVLATENMLLRAELDRYKKEAEKIPEICKRIRPSSITTDDGKCTGGIIYDNKVEGKYKRLEDWSPCKICPKYKEATNG